MLTGALVGAVVGVIVFIIRSIANAGDEKVFKEALLARKTGGIAAARAVVDRKFPKPYPQRSAALYFIGDREGLEQELGRNGQVKLGFARAYTLLGLIALGDTARAQQLTDHAASYERDAPAMFKALKKKVNAIAALGRVVAGAPSTEIDKLNVHDVGMRVGWLTTMLWDIVARVFERDARTELAQGARLRLQGFDKARQEAA